MPFISFSFAVFFITTASLYHLAPRFGRNALFIQQILLLATSLVFYAFASLRFVPFLLYVIAVSYLAGQFVRSRVSLVLFVIADLMPLLFFKYVPQDQHTHWIFPLGLLFFTFQSISYIADVYQSIRNMIAQFARKIKGRMKMSTFQRVQCLPRYRIAVLCRSLVFTIFFLTLPAFYNIFTNFWRSMFSLRL